MESKNIKPRIIAALRDVGEPMTARGIADIGMIDELIYAKLKKMADHMDVVRIYGRGRKLLYALPEWQPKHSHAADGPAMAETPLVATPTENQEPPKTTQEKTQYTSVMNMLRKQKQMTDDVISEYVCRMLDDDPIYQLMVENRNKISMIMREIETERLA